MHKIAIILLPFALITFIQKSTSQSIESVLFSAGASNDDNFQPVLGLPYGASLIGTNGSLEISAAYGEGTYQQSTLSTDKIDIHSKIRVFPNPVDIYINIDLSEVFEDEYILEIRDISSKLILAKKASKNVEYFDLSHLLPGIYILNINGESTQATYKIIKRI